MNTKTAILTLCLAAASGLEPQNARNTHGAEIATVTTLPSFGVGSEALAIDGAGMTAAGSAWDHAGLLHAVKWTLQADGSWTMTDLPWPQGASSAIARGINNAGDVAGNDFPGSSSRPLVWPFPSGVTVLTGCPGNSGPVTVYGISANAQSAVGISHGTGAGSVWSQSGCESLPPLSSGAASSAYAINGDATIAGGAADSSTASSVPVRWTKVGGAWQVEQLDDRAGTAFGANTTGDLAGYVVVPCALTDGCERATIWYASGGSRQLGTLGGDQSWARDINSSGEVVGLSTAPRVGNTAYFWSESLGMVQLPFEGRFAVANALSDVRADGTRIVVGMDSQGNAIAWVLPFIP
jgi:uncharacterized membrane protein